MKFIDNYDLFIFDFDGTIANTLPLYFESFRKVLASFNQKEFDDQEIESWFGPNELGILKQRLKDQNDLPKAEKMLYSVYQEDHETLVKTDKNILIMLNRLKKYKKQIAMVTGKCQRTYEYSARALNLEETFQYEITGDDVKNPKPNSEGLEKVIAYFQIDLKRVLYVGDSDMDILAAEHAAIDSVGVTWFNPHKAFKNTPTYLSTSPLDLIN
ncbi:phosphohydrolase [Enterococcus florum]|uniref:Phosphohydrolase n=1 Tax=Enterococcus florum TaxID=2480627 RepID=A0A4P5PAV7_9ENTE|nr:HAD family hydrolase [Enterococcus florum]GCF93118.1 phosphohydrolase [Enterococcus florum]